MKAPVEVQSGEPELGIKKETVQKLCFGMSGEECRGAGVRTFPVRKFQNRKNGKCGTTNSGVVPLFYTKKISTAKG